MASSTAVRPSTGSRPGRPPHPPGGGGGLGFLWTQLTAMRTALVLLFGLALAAIPGSFLPQRRVSPVAVSDYLSANPRLGPIFDRVGLFEVYTSPWFSAVYLLLFVSLVGCIIPRIGVYARAMRAAPPRTPTNLARLPAYATGELAEAAGLLPRAAEALRQRRYRVVEHDDGVAAERGYLREAGNLVFHVSLLFLLLGVALGILFGFRGSSVVIVGQGFANNLTQYDDFSSGARFTETDLVPFGLTVKKFDVAFETGPVQTGAARLFRAEIEVTDRPGAAPRPEVLEVNHPITIGGTTVHLIGHGYAPVVTVTDGEGNVAFSGPVPFLPQNGNFTSAGAIKVPDARPEVLGFQAFFLPSAVVDEQGPRSVFPDAIDPQLFTNVWSGPPKEETGRPESVYTLDTTGMTPLRQANGDTVRIALKPGEQVTLAGGKGSIRLDGWQRWVKLQVSDTPGVGISLIALAFAVAGLCLSLFVRPRRVWVRVRDADDGRSLVEVGGLDRADARAGLTDDVAELAAELTHDKELVGAK